MYKTFNDYCHGLFGEKVYKLSLDAGFTCPNRDGTLGTRGCIFCAGGSNAFAEKSCGSLTRQLEQAKARVANKNKSGKYIAYFQAFTNTYAPADVLEPIYREALDARDIVGLAIGTRPDCLPPETLSLLARLNREKPVIVELGLQTVHPQTVRYIRRGYDNRVYFDAVRQLKSIGIHVVTHIIIGLPGENTEMAVQTTQAAVRAGSDGVKFHLLHVLRGTDLARDHAEGKFRCLTLEEYAKALKACLAEVPPEVIVHRITGDGAKKDLIAPEWSADKKRVLNYLSAYLKE